MHRIAGILSVLMVLSMVLAPISEVFAHEGHKLEASVTVKDDNSIVASAWVTNDDHDKIPAKYLGTMEFTLLDSEGSQVNKPKSFTDKEANNKGIVVTGLGKVKPGTYKVKVNFDGKIEYQDGTVTPNEHNLEATTQEVTINHKTVQMKTDKGLRGNGRVKLSANIVDEIQAQKEGWSVQVTDTKGNEVQIDATGFEKQNRNFAIYINDADAKYAGQQLTAKFHYETDEHVGDATATINVPALDVKAQLVDANDQEYEVTAVVQNVESVEGKFKATLDGERVKQIKRIQNGITFKMEDLNAAEHKVVVTFEGKLNGKDGWSLTGETTINVNAEEYPMSVTHSFNKEEGLKAIGQLYIPKSQTAKGDWTFIIKDGQGNEYATSGILEDVEGTIQEHLFRSVKEPGKYILEVRFQGQVSGKDAVGSATEEFEIPAEKPEKPKPAMDFRYIENNGSHTFVGELKNVYKAKGDWFIGIANKESRLLDYRTANDHEGLVFGATFQGLKPGDYYATVIFVGKADDQDFTVIDTIGFTVEKDGKCKVTKPGHGDQDKDGDMVTKNPQDGKKAANDAVQGGKLPKTATNLPTGALIGGLVLLAGLGLFFSRRLVS